MRNAPRNEAELDDLIARNPRVDGQKLRESLALIRELREAGLMKEKGYELAHPFAPFVTAGRPR
jgi:hypothetical protein